MSLAKKNKEKLLNYAEMSDGELLELLSQTRTNIAKEFNEQMAIKILLNSLYGATASIYFLYFIMEMAESITTNGQLTVRWAANWMNERLNKLAKTDDIDFVIYIDTDSIHFNMEPIVKAVYGTADIPRKEGEDFLLQFCKRVLEPELAKSYEALADTMKPMYNKAHMKLELIADISVYIQKKRYLINTLNQEGVHYNEPKLYVTGVESVRSSTPEICRDKFQEAYGIIMNSDEASAQDFIKEFKEEFKSLGPEDISRNSGVNDLEKYASNDGIIAYKKRTPQHVRGALLFNQHIKKLGLENKYEAIKSGDKVKILYLKLPNPIQENIISYQGILPRELNLHDYVDYETQFSKVFLDPLVKILDIIGWSPEELATLDQFFM